MRRAETVPERTEEGLPLSANFTAAQPFASRLAIVKSFTATPPLISTSGLFIPTFFFGEVLLLKEVVPANKSDVDAVKTVLFSALTSPRYSCFGKSISTFAPGFDESVCMSVMPVTVKKDSLVL